MCGFSLQLGERPGLVVPLKRYLCLSVFPFLASHAPLLRHLLPSLHVLATLLSCALRYSHQTQLSSSQVEQLASFFVAATV